MTDSTHFTPRCSHGTPQDFRSEEGLYELVKARYPAAVVKGKDLFSSGVFRSAETTSLFYSFAAELKDLASSATPSSTHRFIKKLDETGKLLRSYSQNIDGLEQRAGVICSSTPDPQLRTTIDGTFVKTEEGKSTASSLFQEPAPSLKPSTSRDSTDLAPSMIIHRSLTKNVQLHGSIHHLRCTVCSGIYAFSTTYLETCRIGSVPDCPACELRGEPARLFYFLTFVGVHADSFDIGIHSRRQAIAR